MSNPWHGEIAALSRLHLIRDNMGGHRQRVGGGGGEGERLMEREREGGRR